MKAEEINARLLYRDGLMLVLDKPAGMPVHAGPGGGDNLERHFDHLRFGLPNPPALAHRLDRDTSGCLVLGRHRKALARLGRLFQEGKVEKVYWAITTGSPSSIEGIIDVPLAKVSTKAKGWRMVADPNGQSALTHYKVMGSGDGLCWIELKPQTGRTHQIRVHCSHLGCPILGDRQYVRDPANAAKVPLHLHSRSVCVPLYPKKAPITVIAEPPAHMLAALRKCGWRAEASHP